MRVGVVPSGLPGGDGVLLGGFGLVYQCLWLPVVRRGGVGRVDFGELKAVLQAWRGGVGHNSSLPEK